VNPGESLVNLCKWLARTRVDYAQMHVMTWRLQTTVQEGKTVAFAQETPSKQSTLSLSVSNLVIFASEISKINWR